MTLPNQTKSLLSGALGAGALSLTGMGILDAPDLGAMITNALGVGADTFESSEAFLGYLILDDSGSIRFVAGNTEAVREGANGYKAAMMNSGARDGILISAVRMNDGKNVFYPFGTLEGMPDLDEHNYNPNGGTPLYDSVIAGVGTLLAKEQEFKNAGVPTRGALLVVTDGDDQHSRRTAADCKRVVEDLLRRENFIVALMGIDDGRTDYHAVAEEMGIPREWVLTPKNTPSEIRKAFQVMSRASQAASQGAASFSKTAAGGLGGFGAP